MASPDPTLQQSRSELRKTSRNVQANAEQVKASARHLEDSAHSIARTTDRATELAADRTMLAAERTYAAWIRTGLAALASGVGARALLDKVIPGPLVMLAATMLTLFSAFCFCAAVWREIVPRWNDPPPSTPRIPRALLFAINGSLTAVALSALAGIWIGWLHSP